MTAGVCAVVGSLAEAFPYCRAVLKLPAAIRGTHAKVAVDAGKAIADAGMLRFCAHSEILSAGACDLLGPRSETREWHVFALNTQGQV